MDMEQKIDQSNQPGQVHQIDKRFSHMVDFVRIPKCKFRKRMGLFNSSQTQRQFGIIQLLNSKLPILS